jgi:hypothetical protein
MPFRDAEPASPITRGVFACKNGFSPTRLGSDLRRFLLHAELTPSSARWDLSERLLSSSLPFQIYFIPYNFITKSGVCQGGESGFSRLAEISARKPSADGARKFDFRW